MTISQSAHIFYVIFAWNPLVLFQMKQGCDQFWWSIFLNSQLKLEYSAMRIFSPVNCYWYPSYHASKIFFHDPCYEGIAHCSLKIFSYFLINFLSSHLNCFLLNSKKQPFEIMKKLLQHLNKLIFLNHSYQSSIMEIFGQFILHQNHECKIFDSFKCS